MKKTLRWLPFVALILAAISSRPAHADWGGEPQAPKLVIEPQEVHLGSAREPGSQAITLRNAGVTPLEIRTVKLAPGSEGWQIIPPPERVLMPGTKTQISLSFTPDGRRLQAFGALQIVSNDPS